MPLYIRDTQTIPDGGFRYPHPGGNGLFIVVRNYQIFYDEIVKVYTSNNQPVPSREDVTLYICTELNLPCYEGQEPFINGFTQGLPSKFQNVGCCK